MSHRLGVTSSNTVVIYSTPNIDTPVVAVAAWLLGVSVVAWAPEQSTDELACFGALIALPQAFFTTQALLPALMRLLGRLGASASQRPIVLLTDSGGRNAARPENALSIQELYTPRPGETPFERTPLTQNQAQLYTAVIYFTISRSYEGSLVAGTPVHMDHANAISNYLELLRPTSLVPHAAAAATANVSLEPERQTRMPPRPAHEEQSPAQARSGYHIAYSILRLNHSFLLHRIVCDIFCRGGAYLVARSFDPAEFVDLVGRYRLKFAELTHADVLQLIDYLNYPNPPYRQSPSSASGNNRVATALAPLRYICTDSREMEAELSPILRTLLPNVEIVCTRFGAYLDLPDQTRR
ncbi:hypothetical protein GGI04_004143 [Coemansia thaxteri]|nr:hypothetical protein GGI04_004143 [Coemansia thaxteri]